MGCEFSRLVKELITAGAADKPGAFRKTMLEYTPAIPWGQHKSPDSLEAGHRFKTGGIDTDKSGENEPHEDSKANGN